MCLLNIISFTVMPEYLRYFGSSKSPKGLYVLKRLSMKWITKFCLINLLALTDENRITFLSSYLIISRRFSHISEVPQASNLGSLYFVIDMCLRVSFRLYADDLKIYVIINKLSDCLALESALLDIQKCSNKNKLFLSISKCRVVSFSAKAAIQMVGHI